MRTKEHGAMDCLGLWDLPCTGRPEYETVPSCCETMHSSLRSRLIFTASPLARCGGSEPNVAHDRVHCASEEQQGQVHRMRRSSHVGAPALRAGIEQRHLSRDFRARVQEYECCRSGYSIRRESLLSIRQPSQLCANALLDPREEVVRPRRVGTSISIREATLRRAAPLPECCPSP